MIGLRDGEPEFGMAILDGELFQTFLRENRRFIIRAEFPILLVPLNPDYKSFRICSIRAIRGMASVEFISNLEVLISIFLILELIFSALPPMAITAMTIFLARFLRSGSSAFKPKWKIRYCPLIFWTFVSGMTIYNHFSDPELLG